MKKFAWRITIALLPLLLGTLVVVNAFSNYYAGQGGFRLGVDLVGGTILIYEVDESKFPDGKLPNDWNPAELARRLKNRIDPNDLYNITVRVAGKTRFEIILPTGGQFQVRHEENTWKKLLEAVQEKYPIDHYDVREGFATELLAQINSQYPDKPLKELRDFVDAGMKKYNAAKPEDRSKVWAEILKEATTTYKPKEYDVGRGRAGDLTALVAKQYPETQLTEIVKLIQPEEKGPKRKRGALTTEQVQERKELISQVGSLEFRIPANRTNDEAAMDAAKRYIARAKDDPKVRKELDDLALFGKLPPPPTSQPETGTGNLKFDTRLGQYSYSWVELGADFRFQYGLANPRDKAGNLKIDAEPKDITGALDRESGYREFWNVKRDREAGQCSEIPFEGTSLLVYSREVRNTRLSDKDREKKIEYFMLMRDPESPDQRITGEYLASAGPSPEGGKVLFRMKPPGTELFYELTRRNKGQPLAIVLDGYLESIAGIRDAIRGSGEISGNFTAEKVDRTVQVLRSGALPGTLKREPVSESSMGPTLGADTITRGTYSIIGAFIAVLVFMVVWYFFAGFVACIALFANLLLTVAFMVMIDAAFTLPGLAGLVLTLGMAVDANILIYERIREERKRGLDIKRAIGVGYDRALPTIIDTHLSSIFTAIVLYVVGNDQLKGFGISLTVGLVISLFTSLYITRLIFDIWQDRGWLTKLTMPIDPFTGFKIDFMKYRWAFFTVTIGLTILGGALFISRLDHGALNIDFVKGTAYTGELVKPVEIDKLRDALAKADLPDLSVEQLFISAEGYTDPKNPRASKLFTLRTTETDVSKVTEQINTAIGGSEGEVRLKKIGISKDVEFLPSAESVKSVVLTFTDGEDASKLAFASRAKVGFQLNDTILRMVQEREDRLSKDKDLKDEEKSKLEAEVKSLKAFAQAYTINGLGKDKDGNYQFVEVQFIDTIKPEDLPLLKTVLAGMQKAFEANPLPERLENFDPQLARETQTRALYAIVASWGAILLYLWFRFGSWTFGLAAVLCLIHDLFFALGAIAVCHYLYASAIGQMLMLQDFKIDLPAVAALLTLVGYSVNDTIVVFDRIREVRGKNPALTESMINDSINQTLSRTILASFTTFLVVFVLYWLGGEGVHLFAFVMVVGIIVGTYSSIYIAAPLLLIFGEGHTATGTVPADRPAPRPEGAPA